MEDTGTVRFHGNLDPRAQEFRPRINPYTHNHLTLVQPQIYYAYPSPPYPFPPPPPPSYATAATPPLPPPSTTPSRTLLLSSVSAEVSESTVRRDLEIFGDVRAVQMERLRDGIVTVHFYDLRHAQTALMEIREQHMQQQSRLRLHFDSLTLMQNWTYDGRSLLPQPLPPPAPGLIAGRAVWAQFMIPAMDGVPDGNNQGTLVIFNLDSDVSTSSLRQLFEAFGAVKEMRETPLKRHQRFVEFYDIRNAAKALQEMNGKEIHGKVVVIEFSRPGGHSKRFSKLVPPLSPNKYQSTPNNNFSPRYLGHSSPPPPPLPRRSPTTLVPPRCYNYNSTPHFATRKSGFASGKPNGNNWNGHQGTISNGKNWNGHQGTISNGNGSEENRFQKKNSKKSRNQNANITNQQQNASSKSSRQWKLGRQGKNYDARFLINEDAIVESNCSDTRTTVMIKNIPNKYSQKLLLNMLDNHCIHCNEQIADNGGGDADHQMQPLSSYDFVYLPIDFTNKCNVGYGFVNMTTPQATLRLYKAFHLQNWEVFNSRKICEVTYARLQGVEALKEHFKNSKFPCEAEEYMPVVFAPPRDGQLVTEPTPIVGRANHSPASSAVSSKEEEEEEEEDQSEAAHDEILDGCDGPPEQDHEDHDFMITLLSHNDNDDADLAVDGGRTPNGGGDNGGLLVVDLLPPCQSVRQFTSS